MSNERFYADLPILSEFEAVAQPENYVALPENWHVVVADVEGSTVAIQAGLYKEVNVVGVSVIMALLNEAKPLAVPFVFGGDGASLCIPPQLVPAARRALLGTQKMAQDAYQLNLRVGIVPVTVIHQANFEVLVARYRVSADYIQAVFTGGGLEFAENYLKDEKLGQPYRLQADDAPPEANFSGLECRWRNVPSQHGETISLLVKVLQTGPGAAQVYQQVIEAVNRIYGNEEACHPVNLPQLQLTMNNRALSVEERLFTAGQTWWERLKYALRLRLMVVLGYVFMRFGFQSEVLNWGDYRAEVRANTDFRKFDDMLRQVLSGTAAQREELAAYLEDLYQRGVLVYGIHASASALITCLINDRGGEHFHFVDGAEGGYAMAALQLKAQLKAVGGNI